MKWALRLALATVILAEAQSIWTGFADRARYNLVFPSAIGALYWISQATSLAAGLNAALLWTPSRWLIGTNVAIGLWSIALVGIVGGPPLNQVVVAVACAVTTALALTVRER